MIAYARTSKDSITPHVISAQSKGNLAGIQDVYISKIEPCHNREGTDQMSSSSIGATELRANLNASSGREATALAHTVAAHGVVEHRD